MLSITTSLARLSQAVDMSVVHANQSKNADRFRSGMRVTAAERGKLLYCKKPATTPGTVRKTKKSTGKCRESFVLGQVHGPITSIQLSSLPHPPVPHGNTPFGKVCDSVDIATTCASGDIAANTEGLAELPSLLILTRPKRKGVSRSIR